MITDRSQVPDLVRACVAAAPQVSTILLREKDWSFNETAAFCHQLQLALDKAGFADGSPATLSLTQSQVKPRLILNWNGLFDPAELPIQGLHLGFELACQLAASPPDGKLDFQLKKPLWKIGASVHHPKEWDAVCSLPLDYVLLSNVFATPCKPHKEGLGLLGTETLFKVIQRDQPAIQAYALGGLKPQDLERIMALGLQGIALRSAFF